MDEFWKPGDVIVSRGIYREKIWSAVPTIVVKDTLEELILTVLPGSECLVEETYSKGKKAANRLWDFKVTDWRLIPFKWHTNRLLILHKPDTFYSTRLFWRENTNEFLGYYVNFQLPYKKRPCGIDTLDLELDMDINPGLNFQWKDRDEYEKAIDYGLILSEWACAIEAETPELLDRLENRQYPFDGSWLDWIPDPNWTRPKLPENWDQI